MTSAFGVEHDIKKSLLAPNSQPQGQRKRSNKRGKHRASTRPGKGNYIKAPLLRDKVTHPTWMVNAAMNNPGAMAAMGAASMAGGLQGAKPHMSSEHQDNATMAQGALLGGAAGHGAREAGWYAGKKTADKKMGQISHNGQYGPYKEGPHQADFKRLTRAASKQSHGSARAKASYFHDNYPKGAPGAGTRKVMSALDKKPTKAAAVVGGAALGAGVMAQRNKVNKRMTKKDRHDAGSAAIAGSGATAAGIGLIAGGIPGAKPNPNSVWAMKPGSGSGLRRAATTAVGAAPAIKATPGGILAYRHETHKGGLAGFEEDAKKNAAQRKTNSKVQAFYRGHNAGKIAPEKAIMQGMATGRKISHGVLAAGLATTAYGVHRLRDDQKKIAKRDNHSKVYNGALAGGGLTAAAATHAGSKYLTGQERKYTQRASSNVDQAGKLVPAIAGRKRREPTSSQKFALKAFGVEPHLHETMYPKVGDGDIGRDRTLMRGVHPKVAEKAGHLRGAAAQDRHFAEVFHGTSKVVRSFRTPSAIVGALGAGGLVASARSNKKKAIAKRLMSDAELKRRKKLQGKITYTTSTLGLTGAALVGASALASHKPGALKAIRKVPKMGKVTPNKLKDAGYTVGATSGAIGGVGGYNFAAYTNAESRKRNMVKKAWSPVTEPVYDSEGLRARRNKRQEIAAGGIGGTGAAAAVPLELKARKAIKAGTSARKLRGGVKGAAATGVVGLGTAGVLHARRKSDSWASYSKSASTSAFGIDHA